MMLQINLVIEDTKVSLTDLEEEISEIEEYVQSTDVIGKSFPLRSSRTSNHSHTAMQKL
jgi:hypothetical protein